MKKTLVALAALAATGAFAQAKLTGEYAFGYQSTTAAAGNAGGWGVDTSMIQVDASEDLGGGMSIAATLGIQNIQRVNDRVVGTTGTTNTNMDALNSQLTLTTGVGQFWGGNIRSGDFVKSFSNVGGTWYSLDGSVTPARTKGDAVGFATKLGAIGFGFQHSEPTGTSGLGAGAEGQGAQRSNSYTLTYSAGALSAGLGLVQYDAINQAAVGYKDAARVGVNYDFGMAKVGAALQQANGSGGFNGAKATVTAFGVTVPMGALALSANWLQTNVSDTNVAAIDGSNSGSNLEAKYSLSKQTYVIASYNSYTSRDFSNGVRATDTKTQTNLILVKDF